jgi:hypothetical protein
MSSSSIKSDMDVSAKFKFFRRVLRKMQESVEANDQSIFADFLERKGGEAKVASKIQDGLKDGIFNIEQLWEAATADPEAYPDLDEANLDSDAAVGFIAKYFMPRTSAEFIDLSELAPGLLFFICNYSATAFNEMFNVILDSDIKKFQRNMKSWWGTVEGVDMPTAELGQFFGIMGDDE